jgi:hypothetical protein
LTEGGRAVSTPTGKVDLHLFNGEFAKVGYCVMYSDNPIHVPNADPE